MRTVLVAALLALPFLGGPPSIACTTFCLVDDGQVLFGKNYDWNVDHGLIVVNKRGMERVSGPDPGAAERPARWISRYGSVSFNQYGRDFPSGGMNEAGLVVELMWLDGSAYPAPDARPALGVLEWIQYQLDRSATVADVIGSDSEVRIAGRTPLHYLVADRAGRVAAIEFLDDGSGARMVARTGGDLPARALTNHRYDESAAFMRGSTRSGDTSSGAWGRSSLERFVTAARRAESFRRSRPGEAVRYAFETLEKTAQPSTQWSIVYDVGEATVHFRTRRQPAVRSVKLSPLDFACAAPVLVADLNEPATGDLTGRLRPWTFEENLRLVRASYAETAFLKDAGEGRIQAVAAAPESSVCRGTADADR
ncbi:MAG TPA: linear amide C-N hydrolase [Candidatus Polarisedimenticolia bacterium]|nr:linear amide C-N hydrolase [Candidatus Polarisedimenticolia bacterium]